jgi:hypothetical protein
MGGACSTHGEMRNTKFWSKILEGRDHSEGLGVDEKILLKLILGKYVGKVWSECI